MPKPVLFRHFFAKDFGFESQAGFYAEIEECETYCTLSCHTREKLNIRRKIVIVQPRPTKTATGRILSGGCALVLSILVKVPKQGEICYPTIRVYITMLFIFLSKIRTSTTICRSLLSCQPPSPYFPPDNIRLPFSWR